MTNCRVCNRRFDEDFGEGHDGCCPPCAGKASEIANGRGACWDAAVDILEGLNYLPGYRVQVG